jgi:type IV pilus assembly protein PilQ
VNRLDYFVGQQPANSSGQAGQQGTKMGPYWISVKDSLVTVDVTNAPLDRVLSDMIRQLNTDVVFYNAVTGTVTARATNVSLDRAMDLLLRNTNFDYHEADGIFFVGEKANKALMATKLLKLKCLRAEKILDMIPQSITSQATVKVMKEQNGIVLIAPHDVIAQVEEFFKEIDKPVAQVLIEAIVVDYDRTRGLSLGVDAGFRTNAVDTTSGARTVNTLIPGVDVLYSGWDLKSALQGIVNIGKLPNNFYLNLKALEQKGIANIRSRPLLATLNGTPGQGTRPIRQSINRCHGEGRLASGIWVYTQP